MARKRKPKQKPKQKPRKVVRLDVKRAEKMEEQLLSMVAESGRALDEQVALIRGFYREWERENPSAALKGFQKMAMVRLGFIGPGGFDRCHEPGRLPEDAFISEDHDLGDELLDDYKGAEVLMCPAKASGRCQGIWRGVRMPPCYLLLLEVYEGLGGGVLDDRVDEVVSDFGKWPGPEEYAESFAEAERVRRRYERK